MRVAKRSDSYSTDFESLSTLSPHLLLWRSGIPHKLLQSNFCCIFFGIVDVLAIIPETGIDHLIAFDGDGRGPGSTSTSTIGDDIEDWRVLLSAATVVYSQC